MSAGKGITKGPENRRREDGNSDSTEAASENNKLRHGALDKGMPQMFSKVIDFAKVLYVICRLEAGPQKLPFSAGLLILTLILYISSRLLVETFDRALIDAGTIALFDATLLVLAAGVPLYLLNLGDRILQTLTALISAGIVVSAIEAFVSFLLIDLPVPPERLGPIIVFLTFPLLLWKLFINTNILRHALSWRFSYAFLLSLGHILIVVFMAATLPTTTTLEESTLPAATEGRTIYTE